MQAVVVKTTSLCDVDTVPIPTCGDDQILVATRAIALNPADWKLRDFLLPDGAIVGCDFVGVVTSVGKNVTQWSGGERVAGAILGDFMTRRGSFAEKLCTDADIVWRAPDNINDEEAASIGGIAAWTAFQGLHLILKTATSTAPLKDQTEPILIWGASGAVGMHAVQLAKLAGYTVIATCSPKNFEVVRSFGADAVYDYADAATPASIALAYPDLRTAFDTRADARSSKLAAAAIGEKGGRVARMGVPVKDANGGFESVEVLYFNNSTISGKEVTVHGKTFPPEPESRKALAEWLCVLPSLVQEGKYRPLPLLRLEGGLDSVNDGLEMIKADKVSARKITVKV